MADDDAVNNDFLRAWQERTRTESKMAIQFFLLKTRILWDLDHASAKGEVGVARR